MSITNKEDILVDAELSKSERRAKERYTKESAKENLKEIRAFSSKFLEILCSIFMSSSKDAIGFLQVYHCCLQYRHSVILLWGLDPIVVLFVIIMGLDPCGLCNFSRSCLIFLFKLCL